MQQVKETRPKVMKLNGKAYETRADLEMAILKCKVDVDDEN